MKTFKLGSENVYLVESTYQTTGNIALNAVCTNGEPYCNLTVNLDVELENNTLAYLNVNLHGIDVEEFFTINGLGVKVEGRERQSGYLTYPLYKLNFEAIREPVDWDNFSAEIEAACQKHRDVINSEMGQFIAQGNADYGKEWLYVFWYNKDTKKIETYDVTGLKEAQDIIDYYKFSQGRTKVIRCHNGEDVTARVTFSPDYHDTFKI